jgi:predicted transcriptional regulator
MADAHAGHGDAHAAPAAGGGGITAKSVSKFVLWFSAVFIVGIMAIFLVVLNPVTAQNFVYFLQGLQVLFGVVIVFCFYKLQDFRKRFLATCHEIDHLFADKNGQGHGHGSHSHGGHAHDDHGNEHGHGDHHHKKDESNKFLDKTPENIYEEKFQRAMKNVSSEYKEEWRLGLVELEKLLRELLVKKNYSGETLIELLTDAKEKGFSQVENAEVAIRTRRFLSRDLVRLPDAKDHNTYKNVATLYKFAINALID